MNIQDLLNNPMIGGGAALALFGSLAYTLKEIPSKLFGIAKKKITSRFIYTVRVYEYDDLFDILEQWIYRHHQSHYRDVQAHISQRNTHPEESDTKQRVPIVYYRQAPNMFTIKHNGKTIFITKEDEKLDHATSFNSLYMHKYIIRGYKCKDEITNILQSVVNEYYGDLGKNNVTIRTNDEYGNWQQGNNINVKGIDNVILDPTIKEKIILDLASFKESKEWYNHTGIPYKRTYCFWGGPGSGKTSLTLALAAHLGRDIYVLNIQSLKNDTSLLHAYKYVGAGSVLVIEDIDAAFDHRDKTDCDISFSGLLNCTDGPFYKEGLVTCITTNHLDRLDPALLRAGRTDMIIHIGLPAIAQINEFLTLFYEQPISIECNCDNLTLPMSAIQEICIANRYDSGNAISAISEQLIQFEVQKTKQL